MFYRLRYNSNLTIMPALIEKLVKFENESLKDFKLL